MPLRSLDAVAQENGILLAYTDPSGKLVQASMSAKRGLLAALGVAEDAVPQGPLTAAPVMTPPVRRSASSAYLPGWLEDGRTWGVTCQLYSLRSSRNGGIGDFEDLAQLAEILGARGADFLGINPVHALFSADARRFSPYSPSSRRFVSPLYIAVDRLFRDNACPSADLHLGDDGLIDYAGLWAKKRGALETAFSIFQRGEGASPSCRRVAAFRHYLRQQGRALEEFATFEALSEHQVAEGRGAGWNSWSSGFRRHDFPEVRDFRATHRDRVLFHAWLQWIAATQLENAQRRAKAAGMRIGLYLDIAVGVAPDGADTWCAPEEVLASARIGAPPDAFNVLGQDWGLAPLSPRALSEGRSGMFREVIESAARYAGAVRIDHAMALTRLYLIPDGNGTRDGAYVHYPLDDLLDIVCEISKAHEVIIVGEDLGIVPSGFREALCARDIQGYKVLIFERTSNGFVPPAAYDRVALACIGTHDLPTLAGWWRKQDIDDRERLGILDHETAESARNGRAQECHELCELLKREELVPDVDPAKGRDATTPMTDAISIAVHVLLARTPCRMVAVQLEDLIGFAGAMNLPGTIDEHPNWRQRLPIMLEDMENRPLFVRICDAMSRERAQP
jgi:4-alpha-glucanotransferase